MKDRHLSTDRAYRDLVSAREGEVRFRVTVEETDLLIVAERDLSSEIAAHVTTIRGEIKNWLLFHPEFGESLTPIDVPADAPDIIRHMAEAARLTGVGPMAAVAGAVAQSVGERFASESPNLLVENGGDTYLHSTRPRVAALLADPSSGASIGIQLEADAFPLSICASSSTIGHSLSLGAGDLVAVRAKDARLADCAATHLCNMLRSKSDINAVLARAKELSAHGLDGIFAQLDETVAAWGDLELVALE